MRLPNEDELSNLDALHKIASILEEDGAFEEAEFVNDLFLKLSAKKKKKKSGKNVPNNPSLWASCKAWAKRTFDVYPSAYANGAAAKRYKSKGGTWRKADSELNTRLAQVNIVNQSTMYDGQYDTSETETPDTTEDLSDDEVTSLANEIRTLDEEADTELRQHNYSRVSEIILEIEKIQTQNPEVADLAKTVLDRLRTFVNLGRQKYPDEDTAEADVIKEMPLKDALEEVKEIIFTKGNYDKAIKFVKDVKLTDGNKDYLSKMLDILIIAKKANPGAKMGMYNDANQLLYLAKQKALRSDPSSNLGFKNIGKTDELIYNYLRKMIQEDPINTGYNQNVYKLALELARLKSKI
jgi:hypothetical protein